MLKYIKIYTFITITSFVLYSCNLYRPVDAKKFPPEPEKRVAKNIEEGRGFRLMDGISKKNNVGSFEFANANPLWRASLDVINFMPLLSVDYGGGLIITDWYSGENNQDSIKLTIQFLSNEIRSDAVEVKMFKKNCPSQDDCIVKDNSNASITNEIKIAILTKAAEFQNDTTQKNTKKYRVKTN